MDKIFDSLDKIASDVHEHILPATVKTHRDRIQFLSVQSARQSGNPWNGKDVLEPTVKAYVNFQRWLAKCPACDGIEYVTPTDPIFFCHECRNQKYGNSALPVIFPEPEKIEEITALLAVRKVKTGVGGSELNRAFTSKVINLPRSWEPGQSMRSLRDNNKREGIK
jgi:hypothetical protein